MPDDTPPLNSAAETFPADREFLLARSFAAPPAAVYGAWTRPELLRQWWGPAGFTVPVAKCDLRPGGAWRLVMRSSERIDYPLKGIYQELTPPSRLVMSVDLHEHPGEWHELLQQYRRDIGGRPVPEMVWLIDFTEHDAGTQVMLRIRFASRTEKHAMVKMGMEQGWSQSFDKLATLLVKLSGKT